MPFELFDWQVRYLDIYLYLSILCLCLHCSAFHHASNQGTLQKIPQQEAAHCNHTTTTLLQATFFLFLRFLCICVLVLYFLVVRAASIDGCLCLSGSLPLLSCMLVLILRFEANKYDDDDDDARAMHSSGQHPRGRLRLRSASTAGCNQLPRVQMSVAQWSFAYSGLAVWNSQPATVRDSSVSLHIRVQVNTILLQRLLRVWRRYLRLLTD